MKDEAVRGWDHAYNISYYYIDGKLHWHSSSSVSSNSNYALENWKNHMHEVSLRNCGLITQSLYQVATETIELLEYEGLLELSEFSLAFEDKVSEPQ